MYILLWILFGGLIGWLASIVMHADNRMGIVSNIVVGLIGSLVGGLIADGLGYGSINAFTWEGTLFSLMGAIILLAVLNLLTNRSR